MKTAAVLDMNHWELQQVSNHCIGSDHMEMILQVAVMSGVEARNSDLTQGPDTSRLCEDESSIHKLVLADL